MASQLEDDKTYDVLKSPFCVCAQKTRTTCVEFKLRLMSLIMCVVRLIRTLGALGVSRSRGKKKKKLKIKVSNEACTPTTWLAASAAVAFRRRLKIKPSN